MLVLRINGTILSKYISPTRKITILHILFYKIHSNSCNVSWVPLSIRVTISITGTLLHSFFFLIRIRKNSSALKLKRLFLYKRFTLTEITIPAYQITIVIPKRLRHSPKERLRRIHEEKTERTQSLDCPENCSFADLAPVRTICFFFARSLETEPSPYVSNTPRVHESLSSTKPCPSTSLSLARQGHRARFSSLVSSTPDEKIEREEAALGGRHLRGENVSRRVVSVNRIIMMDGSETSEKFVRITYDDARASPYGASFPYHRCRNSNSVVINKN